MPRAAYTGPALLGAGFRPFFVAATVFGCCVIPIWWLVWTDHLDLGGPFLPLDWHVHEIVFGYAGAVIAGFLFTAIPNWTGRMPMRGWPLLALASLWLFGRLAVAVPAPLTPAVVAALDCAFLLAITAIIFVEIVAGRNWRNLIVVGPIALLAATNILFHVEAASSGEALAARRLGLAVVVFLITLIGGRIIPSFTRNWLVQRGASRLPAPFGRFDAISLLAGAAALLGWTGWPETPATAALLAMAGLIHLVRLSRWRGPATWRSPILLILHLSYAFIPAGFLALAGAGAGWVTSVAGVHFWGIGSVVGMTMAVMIRATRGHTGRELVAGPALSFAFGLLVAAAVVRGALPGIRIGPFDTISLAALFWTCGFGILTVRLVPWLVNHAPDPKPPSPHPSL